MELTKQIGVLRNRKTLDGRKADRNKVNLEYWNFNENLGDLLAPVVTQWMLHRLGLDHTILWTSGNSVYLLTGTIATDELKLVAAGVQ